LWATACFSFCPTAAGAVLAATTSPPLNCCRYTISTSAGCAPTRAERGLDPATPWVVDVECLAPDALRARLHEFDVILRF
jgi:sulfur relay (sulfurtransferase) DsrF/TusC family protein